jgi:hypothetical protein
MTKISNAVAFYNELRIKNNKKPIVGWKKSMQELLSAIHNEETIAAGEPVQKRDSDLIELPATIDVVAKAVAENHAANEKIARKPVNDDKRLSERAMEEAAKIKPVAKKVKAEVSTAKKRVMLKRTQTAIDKATKLLDRAQGTIVNVAKIAKELGLNPKVARATIRRKNVDRTDEAKIRAALSK